MPDQTAPEGREYGTPADRDIIGRNPAGIALVTPNGVVRECNSGFAELFGFTSADSARGVALTALCQPAETVKKLLWAARSTGHSDGYELRYTRPDRGTGWLLTGASTAPAEEETVIVTMMDITSQKRLERSLERRALFDPLTGLANRVLFEDRLRHAVERSLREGGSLAVLFVDLDDFKEVNDRFGHPRGDRLLVEVAQRLAGSVRAEDTIARFGGDEFTVLLEPAGSWSAAREGAVRIIEALDAPFVIGRDERVSIGASVGVTLWTGTEGEEREAREVAAELIAQSDRAMYVAKARREDGSRYEFHGSALGMEESPKGARPRLHLVYQPIVSLRTGKMAGVEPLVRFEHSRGSLLSPVELLRLAEVNDLSSAFSRWMLLESCGQLARWAEDLPRSRSLSLHPNLSGRQLMDGRLPALVGEIVRSTGLLPERLRFEIRHSDILRHADAVRRLREQGVGIVADQFGVGNSEGGRLTAGLVDAVKVGPELLGGAEVGRSAGSLLQAMSELAHAAGLEAIVVGVESEAELDAIREASFDYAQGHLFSRPVTEAELRELVTGDPDWL